MCVHKSISENKKKKKKGEKKKINNFERLIIHLSDDK